MSHFDGDNTPLTIIPPREIPHQCGTVIAINNCGAEMEVAVEVDMSSRMTLRKAVVEILKQAGSNSTLRSQISDETEVKLK